MKGITLHQPWASAVALGLKRIETRSWSTDYRGELLIHAAGRWTGEQRDAQVDLAQAAARALGIEDPRVEGFARDLPLGAAVAVARLVAVHETTPSIGRAALVTARRWAEPIGDLEAAFGEYGPGRYGWILEAVRPLRPAIRCAGAQRLWTVPAELERRVLAALGKGVAPCPAT